MPVKENSYQNNPVIIKVSILDQDVSDKVKNVDNIESSLDYPNLNEYRVAEASFVLTDNGTGMSSFNPQVANNFFVTNGTGETPSITASGYRAPVKIEAGFSINGTEDIITIYEGRILNVNKNAKTGDVSVTSTDTSQKLRDENVTDFGVAKKMKVESSGGSLHGLYPFYTGLTEPADDSVTGTSGTDAMGDPIDLEPKPVLRLEGSLNERNFRQLATGIETEGGPLTDDPILEWKAPYRYRKVSSVVNEILNNYYGPTAKRDIKLPIATSAENFFSNYGHSEYETAFEPDLDKEVVWQWSGGVTDIESDDTYLYLLVSQYSRSFALGTDEKPIIVRLNIDTNEQDVIAIISNGTASDQEEAWRFVKSADSNTFYVLATTPEFERGLPVFGSYDSSEYNNTVNSKVVIYRVNRPNANSAYADPTVYINTSVSSNLIPQLAMHYHLGFGRTASQSQNRLPNREGNLPDSRRNLYLHTNGDLYYPFANRTKFGVARATSPNAATEMISSERDSDGFNLAGFDFFFAPGSPNQLFMAYTHLDSDNNQSRFRIVRRNIT